jgi:hypothetical protein
MNYSVDWTDEADKQLADIWINASDRDDVTAAANRVEFLWRRDPLGQGESRAGDDRLMFEEPLSVYYRVDPVNHMVWVISVGRTS